MSRLDPRGWYRKPATGIPGTDLSASAARPLSQYTAADSGFLGWTSDPVYLLSAAVLTAGTLYFARVKLATTGPITSVYVPITTQGSALTSSWAAVYAADGTQLGVSADQGTAWTVIGSKTVPLATATASLAAGTTVLVAVLSIVTTGPALRTGSSAASVNSGLTAAQGFRFGTHA